MQENQKMELIEKLNNVVHDSSGRIEYIGTFVISGDENSFIVEIVDKILKNEFLMIFGGVSSGKKILLQNIAEGLGYSRQDSIITLKLGPYIDYRDLVGQYTITTHAQKFEWIPGIISRAMLEGHFLILDGWQNIATDLAQFLVNILDNRTLIVPNIGIITPHPRFRMISTTTTLNLKKPLMEYRWTTIKICDLTDQLINSIIVSKYPSLAVISGMLITVFNFIYSHTKTSLDDLLRMLEYLKNSACCDESGFLNNPILPLWSVLYFICPNHNELERNILVEIHKFFNLDLNDVAPKLELLFYDQINGIISCLANYFYIPPSYFNALYTLNICVIHNFPALLIGQTGVGKTSLVQSLALTNNKKLVVINMGADCDISNSLSNIKHTKFSHNVQKIIDQFSEHFKFINGADNTEFIQKLTDICAGNYLNVLMALNKILNDLLKSNFDKIEIIKQILLKVQNLIKNAPSKNEIRLEIHTGVLTNAMINGDWVLFDEINLAHPDTLSLISLIFDNKSIRIPIFPDPITIHPDFRVFACMNPSNDIGKKSLPQNISRSFVKIHVNEIISSHEIEGLITFFLVNSNSKPVIVHKISKFYIDFREYMLKKSYLCDNIVLTRQLCRSLKIALNYKMDKTAIREALIICFISRLTGIDSKYWENYLDEMFEPIDFTLQINTNDKVVISGFPISRGKFNLKNSHFIITDIVENKLKILARIISLSNIPVLLEGDTAVGKTSVIIHIAQKTGNNYVRINNHEHTDINDYLGSYVLDKSGAFVFKEGALLRAMRQGDWVIIDELNLASSDVLEMLNRLLDDNRELFIEELQEIVRAHADFRIFATQNPHSYSGRKQLSKAFRSRFIELNFDQLGLPENIRQIIENRFHLKIKIAQFMIDVLRKLAALRKNDRVFDGRYGFITIRDLIKWSKRLKKNDTLDQAATIGFQLLSARCRFKTEINTLHTVFTELLSNQKLSKNIKFDGFAPLNLVVKYANTSENFKHLVWTKELLGNMYHILQAVGNHEPVLLIGETGCGKTSLLQLLGEATNRKVFIYNCHSNTESSDILGFWKMKVEGGKKSFIWHDGVLVQAMREGGLFVLDEISLASDSVIERVNSVLEMDFKSLILYEKFSIDSNSTEASQTEVIKPRDNFIFSATMNPSGDYGKRELSPALRNRFTEIWCENSNTITSYEQIFASNLNTEFLIFKMSKQIIHIPKLCSNLIKRFYEILPPNFISIRKILKIIYFINKFSRIFCGNYQIFSAIIESFKTILFESFNTDFRTNLYTEIIETISKYIGTEFNKECLSAFLHENMSNFDDLICGCDEIKGNLNRIRLAMLYNTPILLEGPPGCGKTLNVSFIANFFNKKLYRINFCEQTELSDIIGSFFPCVKDGEMIFEWVNGPFINAILDNGCLLLDEINLACQTVLEGLNSCFDHRSNLYVPELDKTFSIDRSKVFIFATQNPQSFVGRKGLPKSFTDRFIIINISSFASETLNKIFTRQLSTIPPNIIKGVVSFLWQSSMSKSLNINFNIRDVNRFIQFFTSSQIDAKKIIHSIFLTFLSKCANFKQREFLRQVLFEYSGLSVDFTDLSLIFGYFRIVAGDAFIYNNSIARGSNFNSTFNNYNIRLLPQQLKYFGMISSAIKLNWSCILAGPERVGKTSIIKALSMIYKIKTYVISLTSETDACDIIGDFDYYDAKLHFKCKLEKFFNKFPEVNFNNGDIYCRKNHELLRVLVNLENNDQIKNKAQKLLQLFGLILENKISNIRWCEGLLVKCLRKGYWIVFDNINFCNSAVVDRLNSLLEPNGSLMINLNELIHPHENFRFFGIYNPAFGEISAALKNRCLEIYIDSDKSNINSFRNIDKYPLINTYLNNNSLKFEYDFINSSSESSSKLITNIIFIERSQYIDILHRLEFLNINRDYIQDFQLENSFNELKMSYNNENVENIYPIFSWANHKLWYRLMNSPMVMNEQLKLLFAIRYQIYCNEYKNLHSSQNVISCHLINLINSIFEIITNKKDFCIDDFCIFYIALMFVSQLQLFSNHVNWRELFYAIVIKFQHLFDKNDLLKPILAILNQVKKFLNVEDLNIFDIFYCSKSCIYFKKFVRNTKSRAISNYIENQLRGVDHLNLFLNLNNVFKSVIKSDFNNEDFIFEMRCILSVTFKNPLNFDKDSRFSFLNNLNQYTFIERFLESQFPFSIKCLDCVDFGSLMNQKSIEILCNFNIFACWQSILNKLSLQLLESLIVINLGLFVFLDNEITANEILLKFNDSNIIYHLIHTEISELNKILTDIKVCKLTKASNLISRGYIYLGKIILKIYGKLPVFDPCNQEFIFKSFIEAHSNNIKNELNARFNMINNIIVSLSSDEICKMYDKSYVILQNILSIFDSFNVGKYFKSRSNTKYVEFKSNTDNLIQSILYMIESSEFTIESIVTYRENIVSKNVEFDDLIEPIYTALLLVQYGLITKQTTKNISKENNESTNSTDFVEKINSVIEEIEFIYYDLLTKHVTKYEALNNFYQIYKKFSNFVENILNKIDSLDCLNTQTFNAVQPEIQYQYFEPIQTIETDYNEINNENKHAIKTLLSKFMLYFVQKLQLITEFDCSNNSGVFFIKSRWLYKNHKSKTSNIDRILQIFLMNLSYKKITKNDFVQHENVYEYGNPSLVIKISSVLTQIYEKVSLIEIKIDIIDETFELIDRIKSFDISCPLVIYLEKLDKLYQNLESISAYTRQNELFESINLVKNIIIEIRKLQINSWPFILKNYNEKCIKNNSLIYLGVAKCFEIFFTSRNGSEFPSNIKQFIEKQSLATYDYSIKAIYSLLQMLANQYQNNKKFINSVNIINYYQQFTELLNNYSKDHISEIQTELNEFANIAKWRDFNYWSIKESSMKAHHTLHKHVKKYQLFIDQPVSIIINKVSKPINDVCIIVFESIFNESREIIKSTESFRIDENIFLNNKTLKLSNRFSKIFTDDLISAFKVSKEKFLHLKDFLSAYIQNHDLTQNLLDSPDFLHGLMNFDLLNQSKSFVNVKNIFCDIDSYFGPCDFEIQDKYKSIYESNNSLFMRGLYFTQKIWNRIHQIDLPKNDLLNISLSIFNIFDATSYQRNKLQHIFSIYNNFNILSNLFEKSTISESHNLKFSHEIINRIYVNLKNIHLKVYRFIAIFENMPGIDSQYSSPHFPSINFNHSTFSDPKFKFILDYLIDISKQISLIIDKFNQYKLFKFIPTHEIDCLKNCINLVVFKINNINRYMECFSLFGLNKFTSDFEKILCVLKTITDDISHMEKDHITVKDSDDNVIKNLIKNLLIAIQSLNISNFDFKFGKNLGNVERFIKCFSEFTHEYIHSIIEHVGRFESFELYKMVNELVQLIRQNMENYIQFYLQVNLFSSNLFDLISQGYLKSMQSYKVVESNESVDKNNGNLENADEDVQKAGFHDGKGHKDVSDKIQDQDVFEEAIPQDQLFDSSDGEKDSQSELSEENDEGIEISDIEKNSKENGGDYDEEENDDFEDEVSSVSQSICNEINPEVWNQNIESEECEDAETEKKKLDGEKIDDDFENKDYPNMDIDENSECDDKNESYDDQINDQPENESNIDDKNSEDLENDIDTNENIQKIQNSNDGFNSAEKQGSESENENEQNENYDKVPGSKLNNDKNDVETTENNPKPMNQISNSDMLNIKKSDDYKRNWNGDENEIDHCDQNLKIKKIDDSDIIDEKTNGMETDAAKLNSSNINCNVLTEDKNQNLFNEESDDIYKKLQNNLEDFENINLDENDLYLADVQKSASHFDSNYRSRDIKNDSSLNTFSENGLDYSSMKNDIDFNECQNKSLTLASSLCENLRIILEPTKCTKFEGNYRSGRKINIRKIVPYIASEYTKDKIWLRRTKPYNRQYNVIIAIDDSSSMRDNKTRKISLTSLLTICHAFRLLEIGKVSIMSFGESVQTLIDFNDVFGEESAKSIWDKLNFHQSATKITSLLQVCNSKFGDIHSDNTEFEKLLIIISDGRGIFSQGEDNVKNSVHELANQNVLVIFIIMDSMDPKDSITKINVPVFHEGSKAVTIKSYLELFPFPYYLILRDVNDLPQNLAKITQQWMQLVVQQ